MTGLHARPRMTRQSMDDEDLVDGKLVGKQFRLSIFNHDQILKVPVLSLGLHGEDHSVLQHDFTVFPENRLLLVEPGAHAVSDQRGGVINSFFFESVYDECVNFAGCHARTAALDRPAMNV